MKEEIKIKLDDHQRWQGNYKGISFQIAKWKRTTLPEYDNGYTWNYYIFVKPRRLKMTKATEIFPARADYYKMYPDVEMHGGVTYWNRHGIKGSLVDELGCDYGHSWDYEYGERKLKENKVEWVLKDVQNTIDSLPKDLFFNKSL